MSFVRYIVPRVLLIFAGLWLFNKLYEKYFWEGDLNKYEAHLLLDIFKGQDSVQAVYLGESSNFSTHPNDTQTLSISELIDEQIEESILTLNKGAYHAGLFRDLILNLSSPTIRTVIVTLNLRTLNQATMHAEIETALQQQNRFFKPYPPLFNRCMLTLRSFDNTPYAERDKEMWQEWTYDTLKLAGIEFPAPTIKEWCALPKFVDEEGVEDMERRTLADHYVKAYAFNIDLSTHERVRQFEQIVAICNERGYRLVFNLLAENTEYAEAYCGPSLPALMRHNAKILEDHFTEMGVEVVNNLDLVEGIHYTDQQWTTEHYDQVGRQAIANRVVEVLRKQ